MSSSPMTPGHKIKDRYVTPVSGSCRRLLDGRLGTVTPAEWIQVLQ